MNFLFINAECNLANKFSGPQFLLRQHGVASVENSHFCAVHFVLQVTNVVHVRPQTDASRVILVIQF